MPNNSRENWCEIRVSSRLQRTRYAVSDRGRLRSFKEDISTGKLLKGTLVNGYPALKLKIQGKDFQFYTHKLVAICFLSKPGKSHRYVIHLDFNKLNNTLGNLRWATRSEMESHQQSSPAVVRYRRQTLKKGPKLTVDQVRRIKRLVVAPVRNFLLKDIARQFGISEMQLYRIKSGENWSHV
ncbi:MAG: NUMOD4 domain-containing protein [Bacteroidota bacterium]